MTFEDMFQGMQPINTDDSSNAAVWILEKPANVSIKALDIHETAQRSLVAIDREWAQRNDAQRVT